MQMTELRQSHCLQRTPIKRAQRSCIIHLQTITPLFIIVVTTTSFLVRAQTVFPNVLFKLPLEFFHHGPVMVFVNPSELPQVVGPASEEFLAREVGGGGEVNVN